MVRKDLSNKRFGRLKVIAFARIAKNRNALWKCECDCGRTIIAYSGRLIAKRLRSCGCLRKELLIKSHTTHGLSEKPVYITWAIMIQRCTNPKHPNYKYYGGRGIKICKEWMRFENFFADMGDRPKGLTLDRINNNGNYEKENCRWATMTQQARNSRIYKSNTTGVKGVGKEKGKFRVGIGVNGKYKFLGYFISLADAKTARQKAEIKYWKQT